MLQIRKFVFLLQSSCVFVCHVSSSISLQMFARCYFVELWNLQCVYLLWQNSLLSPLLLLSLPLLSTVRTLSTFEFSPLSLSLSLCGGFRRTNLHSSFLSVCLNGQFALAICLNQTAFLLLCANRLSASSDPASATACRPTRLSSSSQWIGIH